MGVGGSAFGFWQGHEVCPRHQVQTASGAPCSPQTERVLSSLCTLLHYFAARGFVTAANLSSSSAFLNPCRVAVLFGRVRKIAKKGLLNSSFLSVRLSTWDNSEATRRIFFKFDSSVFFENLSRKFTFH
jgi:hypothetical protein